MTEEPEVLKAKITKLEAELSSAQARNREDHAVMAACVGALKRVVAEKALRWVASNSFGQQTCWLCLASAERGHWLTHKSDCLHVVIPEALKSLPARVSQLLEVERADRAKDAANGQSRDDAASNDLPRESSGW